MKSADDSPGPSHTKMMPIQLSCFILFLFFLAISCMDIPEISPRGENFVKLELEYAYLKLMRVEDDWCVMFNDFLHRLKPGSEIVLRESSACLAQLQENYSQFTSEEQDVYVIIRKALTITSLHLGRISCNQTFAQGLSVKMAAYDTVIKSLTEILYSGHEKEVVSEMLEEVKNSRNWLTNVSKQLHSFEREYKELLFVMMKQMASKLHSSLETEELKVLDSKIEFELKKLEIQKLETLVLGELRHVGQLIMEFNQAIDRLKPMVELLGRIGRKFPLVYSHKIPGFLSKTNGYCKRHLKLCRQYLAVNLVESEVESFDPDELDVYNEEKFNWKRYREEFIHYYYLRNKADGNPKISKALFGEGYQSDASITFTSAVDRNSFDLAEEMVSPMLVNFPSCPHDIPNPTMSKMTHMTIYCLPMVNLSSYPEYSDGVTFEDDETGERAGFASNLIRLGAVEIGRFR